MLHNDDLNFFNYVKISSLKCLAAQNFIKYMLGELVFSIPWYWNTCIYQLYKGKNLDFLPYSCQKWIQETYSWTKWMVIILSILSS